jgi:hypothetical protein
MRFTTSYQGKSSPDGWITLDLTGVDLDGVNKLVLPMEDIEKLKEGGDLTTDRLKRARSLLGGDPDDE